MVRCPCVAELLEDRELKPGRGLEAGVEGQPRGDRGLRYQVGSAVDELSRHRVGVGDLEGDAESGRDSAPHFDLVDHGHLSGVGELERGATDVEDGDAFAGLTVDDELLGRAEDVAVEGDGFFVVGGLDDQPHLEDSPVSLAQSP